MDKHPLAFTNKKTHNFLICLHVKCVCVYLLTPYEINLKNKKYFFWQKKIYHIVIVLVYLFYYFLKDANDEY